MPDDGPDVIGVPRFVSSCWVFLGAASARLFLQQWWLAEEFEESAVPEEVELTPAEQACPEATMTCVEARVPLSFCLTATAAFAAIPPQPSRQPPAIHTLNRGTNRKRAIFDEVKFNTCEQSLNLDLAFVELTTAPGIDAVYSSNLTVRGETPA
jgi:hypothetical protein